MEVRLLGYQNPTGTCQECPLINEQRRCCDREDTSGCTMGNRRCDSFFTYCLRSFGNEDSQEGGCSDRESMRSDTNQDDDDPIDFFQAIKVLNLDNPFHLQGLTSDYTVSYLVLLKCFVAHKLL